MDDPGGRLLSLSKRFIVSRLIVHAISKQQGVYQYRSYDRSHKLRKIDHHHMSDALQFAMTVVSCRVKA